MASTIGIGLVRHMLFLLAVVFFIHDFIAVEGKNIDAVKTFETEHGDIYDCVDIYKQPAFDHPALKNHEIQYAVANAPPGEYYGTKVYMNIWNPQVEEGFQMFSLAQTWIIAGSGFEINSIEVGWQVSFSMYKDNNPRVFVYWTTDGYRSSGCYNTACPGFVQLNEMLPVDYHLDQYISTYNGKQYDMKINVFKDPGSGNWYLYRDDLAIGYWPSAIFNKLNNKAEEVQWGGEVYHDINLCRSYNPMGNCPYPQMGSGRYPTEGYGKAAYMKELLVIDNPNMMYNPPKTGTFINDKPDIFKITQNQKGIQGLPENHILFGGPGGYSRY